MGVTGKLVPLGSLVFVSGEGISVLDVSQVLLQNVGSKTFGLASIPRHWSLPFFAVSAELLDRFRADEHGREILVSKWSKMLVEAATRLDFLQSNQILIRSSAFSEDIGVRGKFYSDEGKIAQIDVVLLRCLNLLASDLDLTGEGVPLLVQQKCTPTRAKGHLSNERRCYKEARDWLGEFETGNPDTASSFQINLRHWREKIIPETGLPLLCRVSAHVSEVLKHPAAWAHQLGARVHFEWVWDGLTVYLVQADEGSAIGLHDPVADFQRCNYQTGKFTPLCLREVSEQDAKRFEKIKNVFTYISLRLPTAQLYILDDPTIISNLAVGVTPENLHGDLEELIKWSLVIRTDLISHDLADRQLLPTLPNAQSPESALQWMMDQCRKFVGLNKPAAFIFHNFIPALASAYVLAEPRERVVQIEALWGLPQGLYYNPTDKVTVDTLEAEFTSENLPESERFTVRLKPLFKSHYLAVAESGAWELRGVSPPYDWKGSISEDQCRRIALESRRIAIEENRPVSVMWFVGVPECVAGNDVVPWYHERYDLAPSRSTQFFGRRNAFEKPFIIRTVSDVRTLQNSLPNDASLSRIKIQPSDEKLLRDKDTLKKVGELAKSRSATLVLEGAMLSHAYYQLMSTGARVEVVHPFVGFDDKLVFNKLVRDAIPKGIVTRGERVTIASIKDEVLVRALKEKLVEEAFEVLEARDAKLIAEELADVREVISGLLYHLNIKEEEVNLHQRKKRDKRGGFSKGIVLLETQTLLPTAYQHSDQAQLIFEGLQPAATNERTVPESEVQHRKQTYGTRTDRRILDGNIELTASVTLPALNKTLNLETSPEVVQRSAGGIVQGRVRGVRHGSNWNFELFVSIEETQLCLPFGT